MESGGKLAEVIDALAADLIREASNTSRNSALDPHPQGRVDEGISDHLRSIHGSRMLSWAHANASLLHLVPGNDIEPIGFHPVFRVGRDGQLLVEVVVQFAQKAETEHDFGGVPLRGGSTVIVQANGKLRYVISKPLPSAGISADDNRRAQERVERQRAFVQSLDEMDSFHIWKDVAFQKDRVKRLMNLARLHGSAG